MDKFYHSVTLEEDLCKGCINCIKRCPTEAIRVMNGKARIIKEFCIDCGECIRVCPHHAKKATYDELDVISNYEYTVALPAPALYAQFNNLEDKDIIIKALLSLGFDDVYEVASAAEIVSQITRNLYKENKLKLPVISSACPSIVRLIRVSYPNLIDLLLPLNAPVDLAASIAVKQAMEKTGLSRDKIGIIFITPCPAKVTAVHSPIGNSKSEVDACVAIKDIYPKLLGHMKKVNSENGEADNPVNSGDIVKSGKIGVSWGSSGGEAGGTLIDNYLAADGVENVIRVLDDLEDSKFSDLEFIELNACFGGCVGGVLCVENPYLSKVKLNRIRKYLPVAGAHFGGEPPKEAFFYDKIEYIPVYELSNDIIESIALMEKMDDILSRLPGLDCGSCGAPTCKALAMDVIRGQAKEKDCLHILKQFVNTITGEFSKLDK